MTNGPARRLPAPYRLRCAGRAPQGMRTFAMARDVDATGVSGTGVVLEGVVFSTGRVVAHWLTPMPAGSFVIFESWDQFLRVHVASHPENGTRVIWSDGTVWSVDELAVGSSPFPPPGDLPS